MFKRILIANRGEIAVRIIRSCSELGIETIAIYSDGDEGSLHTLIADKSICIGPKDISKSYLSIEKIINVAKLLNVDAIHPGYGLLSENYCFERQCREAGIVFIGPTEENILLFGDKNRAKKFVDSIGVQIVKGSKKINSFKEAINIANEIGYPLVIKLCNGGGGKGIRLVEDEKDFEQQYNLCYGEGRLIGDTSIYLEKYIKNARHIEVQIVRDVFGNCICLGERDCTLQRKYQKIIEESPATILSNDIREKIYGDSIKIANESEYINFGTVEFLIDEKSNYYFLEVNPRIQVEHTITEMLCDIDIVKEQINIALGEEISFLDKKLEFNYHTIECRINAEMPEENFIPSSGKIEKLHFPGGNGLRIDSAIYTDYIVNSKFDSNIVKIIVKDNSRLEAIKKMRRALSETVITGVSTNVEFLQKLLSLDEVINNKYNVNFVEEYLKR